MLNVNDKKKSSIKRDKVLKYANQIIIKLLKKM